MRRLRAPLVGPLAKKPCAGLAGNQQDFTLQRDREYPSGNLSSTTLAPYWKGSQGRPLEVLLNGTTEPRSGSTACHLPWDRDWQDFIAQFPRFRLTGVIGPVRWPRRRPKSSPSPFPAITADNSYSWR